MAQSVLSIWPVPRETDLDNIMTNSNEDLLHFGIQGMHWGQRKNDALGVSRSTNRDASKDAKEFARAKAFYGEGAGTRRKLIKQTVEGKSRKSADYKKAFDHHLSNQDSSKHVDKARAERKRKNAVNSTTKTARGIRHVINGNAQYASLAAAMIAGGAMAAHRAGIDKVIFEAGKTAVSKINDPDGIKKAARVLRDHGLV